MKFCPKCGSLLIPKKENDKPFYMCSCGYSEKSSENVKIKESLKPEEIKFIEEIEVNVLVDEECEKCHHGKSYFWEIQTRASDEPATKFFKCEKCKHIWRDYK